MTNDEVVQLINQLADIRAKISTIEIEQAEMVRQAQEGLEQRKQAILDTLTQAQKDELAEIEKSKQAVEMEISFEYGGKKESAETNALILEGQIREQVLQAGASIKGSRITCQFVRPGAKINSRGLELALKKFEGLDDFVERGEPTVRIVWNK